jgi:hypothetical protein
MCADNVGSGVDDTASCSLVTPIPHGRIEVNGLFRQRLTPRRTLTADPIARPWGAAGGGPPLRPRHIPLVVREPETGCWEVLARDTLTVAAVREGDAGWRPEEVAGRLAALAGQDELLVVFGSNGRALQHAMVAELRQNLPGKDIVTVPVRHRHGQILRDAALVERLLDTDSLPVVVTPANALHDVTDEIGSYLSADRLLRMLRATDSADLHLVRHCRPEVTVS